MSKPTSFKIFNISIALTVIALLVATFLQGFGAILAYGLILVFALSGIGIYSGRKFKSDINKYKKLNRIGLIGNFIIFSFILVMMTYAIFTMDQLHSK